MKKLKAIKLKVSPDLSARLSELGLSHGDVDFLLSFGRRLDCRGATVYVFDTALAPDNSSIADRLLDIALVVSDGVIIDVRRDRASSDEENEAASATPRES
jgi:hypothetical protein